MATMSQEQVVDALAPSNSLLGNPSALRTAVATKGASLGKGARALADDVLHNGAMPKTVDRRPFRLGETIGTSPGAVVLRTEIFELIQYKPSTPTVGTVPVVFIPPEISRHYILDLSPGRSLVEFLVNQGHPVFVMSWRNPAPAHRDWNLDTYVAAEIGGRPRRAANDALRGCGSLLGVSGCPGRAGGWSME